MPKRPLLQKIRTYSIVPLPNNFLVTNAQADTLLKFEGKLFEENAVNFSGHHPMLLGRMDLATDLFVLAKDHIDAGRFLIMQRRYAEAIKIVEMAKADHDSQAVALESQLIPEFVRLNELTRASKMIDSLIALWTT